MEFDRNPEPAPASSPESRPDASFDSDEVGPSDAELEKWQPFLKFLDDALQNPLAGDSLTETRSIGPFRILGILGRGGSSVVYLGVEPTFGRLVALKVPRDNLFLSDDARERFLQEAKIIAELRHPNVVEIYDVSNVKSCPLLVIEYCSGGSLRGWLDLQSDRLTPGCCAAVIRQLASATAHAHFNGVVHRDINPHNVLLAPTYEGEEATPAVEFPFVAKLSDFGLGTWMDDARTAIRTRTGAVIGTLHYMAPEQTRTALISAPHLVDVYALGVMLYELLTNELPFIHPNAAVTIRMIQETDAEFPKASYRSIPRDLATICLKCLEKSPLDRYLSAAALTADLDLFLAGRPILAKRRPFITRFCRSIRKHRERIGSVSLIAVLAIAICVGGLWLTQQLNELRIEAARFQQDLVKKESEAVVATWNERQREAENHTLEQSNEELEREKEALEQEKTKHERRRVYSEKILDIATWQLTKGYDAIQKLRDLVATGSEPDERGFEWYYLMQLFGGDVAAMVVLRPELDEQIGRMHIAPDGKSLFEAIGGILREWDLESGQNRRTVCRLSGAIHDFAIFQDSSRLALGVNGTGILLKSLSPTDTSQRPNFKTNRRVAWTHRLIPSANLDSRVFFSVRGNQRDISAPAEIWSHDARTGKSWVLATWPDRDVRDMAIDPVEQTAIYSLKDSIVVRKDDSEVVQELTLNGQSPLQALSVSANGQFLAASTDHNEVVLYGKSPEKTWERAVSVPAVNHRTSPRSQQITYVRNPLRLSPAGNRLFSACDTEMHRTDLTQRKVTNSVYGLLGNEVRFLELLPDGETVAWATDKAVGQWHPVEGAAPIAGHPKEAWSVAYSSDGKLMATGSDDETVRLWNTASGHMLAELSGHIATVTQVAFSYDGRFLASGSLDGTVRIWDVQSRRLLRTIDGNQGEVRKLAWFKDCRRLVVGDWISRKRPETNSVLIWDTTTGTLLKSYTGFPTAFRSLLVAEDQMSVTGFAEDDVVRIWNLQSDVCQQIPLANVAVRSAALINQGRQFVVGDNIGRIQIRETSDGSFVRQMSGHDGNVLSLAVSPDGRHICSGGADHTIRLWDAETGHLQLIFSQNSFQVNCVSFSPDGQTLAAALHDGTVKLYHAPRINRLLLGLGESNQVAMQDKSP